MRLRKSPKTSYSLLQVFVFGISSLSFSVSAFPFARTIIRLGLFRANIPRFNSSLSAQFPAMFIKITGKCDIAFRTSNPNALSIRFSNGYVLLPAERARFRRFIFHHSKPPVFRCGPCGLGRGRFHAVRPCWGVRFYYSFSLPSRNSMTRCAAYLAFAVS